MEERGEAIMDTLGNYLSKTVNIVDVLEANNCKEEIITLNLLTTMLKVSMSMLNKLGIIEEFGDLLAKEVKREVQTK